MHYKDMCLTRNRQSDKSKYSEFEVELELPAFIKMLKLIFVLELEQLSALGGRDVTRN